MVRVAIVEDEQQVRESLAEMLFRYTAAHDETLDLTEFPDGADIAENYRSVFDVVFLDIQMPGMDGMSAARAIRERDEDVQIVFVTNLAQRVGEGYDVDARAFLVKPVSETLLFRQMDRIMHRIRERGNPFLVFGNTREVHRIRFDDIVFIDNKNHYVKVHTVGKGTLLALSSLKEVERQLPEGQFYRCSHSCIVNLDRVTSATKGLAMLGDQEIAVSRAKQRGFMETLNKRISGLY